MQNSANRFPCCSYFPGKACILTLGLLVTSPAAALPQSAGDSVRIRVIPSNEWIHGHLVSLDSSRIVVGSLDSLKSWTLDSVTRLETWTPHDTGEALLATTLSGAIGFGICAAVRCGGYPPLTGSVGGAIALGAGLGFVLGGLALEISPGQWSLVRLKGR